jgi:hypothetical protein
MLASVRAENLAEDEQTRVVDPDPHSLLVGWIRIQEGKNEKFKVFKCWKFSFEGHYLYGGLRKNKLQFWI